MGLSAELASYVVAWQHTELHALSLSGAAEGGDGCSTGCPVTAEALPGPATATTAPPTRLGIEYAATGHIACSICMVAQVRGQ